MSRAGLCDDCGGFDVEWMYRCEKHGTEYCRGCSCPMCDEDRYADEYDYRRDPGNQPENIR